jgi:hypothetical protein
MGSGSTPLTRHRWRRTLRAGLYWTALGLGSASISYACDPDVAARSLGFDRTVATLFFALVPIPPIALGIRGLALSLRERAGWDAARRTAMYLAARLPESYVVIAHYAPRDAGDDDVPIIVVGPSGVVVIEPRLDEGDVVCIDDHWYRRRAHGVGRRMKGMSPSARARRNVGRVRRDLTRGGFARTPVVPFVVFTSARVVEASSLSVPALEGLDAVVAELIRAADPETTPARMRALAEALVGPTRLAVV